MLQKILITFELFQFFLAILIQALSPQSGPAGASLINLPQLLLNPN